jgi:hypothetical protein
MPEQSKDVVIKGENHQCHQENQSHPLCHFPHLDTDRLPTEQLDEEKAEVASV